MMMRDMLAEHAATRGRPVQQRSPEATSAAHARTFDAAMLDVNLGGELVYPVADAAGGARRAVHLRHRLGAESIDERFSDVPMLQKPVEHALLAEMLSRSLESVPVRRKAQAG